MCFLREVCERMGLTFHEVFVSASHTDRTDSALSRYQPFVQVAGTLGTLVSKTQQMLGYCARGLLVNSLILFHAGSCFEAMVAEATRTLDHTLAQEAGPLLRGRHLQKAGFLGKGHLSAWNLSVVCDKLKTVWLRSGGPRLKSTEVYPSRFGSAIASMHVHKQD